MIGENPAGMAEKSDEAQTLFNTGLESGRTFIKQIESNEVTEDYIRSNVPIGTTMVVFEGGPTTDFILGRLYESVSTYAYDKVVKEDKGGQPLKVGEWNLDKDLKKSIAEGKYLKSNCELLLNL